MPAIDRTDTKVHIDHKDGAPLYDRLYLSTSALVLLFESGHGFIDTLDVARYGWIVKEGWRTAYPPVRVEPWEIDRS